MDEADRIVADYHRRAAEVPPERYEPSRSGPLFIRQAVERETLAMLARERSLPLRERRILDAGCGSGQWLCDFETWGAHRANLAGIDLLPERVEACSARLSGADIRLGDASKLPWEDGSFDIAVQSMMFSSILDPAVRRSVAGELARVLARGGIVLWYDFFVNSPGNHGVRGVRRSEVSALFPGFRVGWRRVTLAPPLVRAVAPRSWALASALRCLRVLNTHALATLRAPTGVPSQGGRA